LNVGCESLQLSLRGAQRRGTVISGFHERKRLLWATAFSFLVNKRNGWKQLVPTDGAN
jgi:hypothetical protein